MPVRASTWVLSGVVQGTSDSRQATWTGRSAEFTRARTAMSDGSTPSARQAPMMSTTVPARASAEARSTATGPAPARGPSTSGRRIGPAIGAADGLGHPLVVVGEQVAGRVHHRRRAPVVHLEGMVGGAGKVLAEVDEELRRGPGVAVDDLVVVADPEAVEARGHQQTDEEEVGGGQVLELVDQHPAAPDLGRRPGRRIAGQDFDGPVDLLVEVHQAPFGERHPVPVEAVGDSRRVGVGLFGRLRRYQAEPHQRQCGQERGRGVGVGLAPDLEQLTDQVAHPHLVDHPDRPVGPKVLQIHRARLLRVRTCGPPGPSASDARSRISSAARVLYANAVTAPG